MSESTAPDLRLPAEWERHQATLLAWPHNEEDWPGKFGPIPWVFAEIARHITVDEDVMLLVEDKAHQSAAADVLSRARVDMARVQFLRARNDRGWMRDCAPTFVQTPGGIRAVQFGFNGWAKYDNWRFDAALPPRIAEEFQFPLTQMTLGERVVTLEGGAIDGNGAGTLLATEECLLDASTQVRNPGMTRADYEEAFRAHLGIQQVIWLGCGIVGDDTHGHVDDLCRFVSRDTVVICHEDKPYDENYHALMENVERLQEVTLHSGGKLQVVPLPMPEPLFFEDTRLPASYANFYLCNGRVLVPTFNDPKDRIALGILAECFPDRQVIGIHAVDLVWGFGTLHCLTHEVPERMTR